MTKTKNYISLLVIFLITMSLSSCGNDDNNQDADVFSGCCSGLTAFGDDVDNLDQSQGDIIPDNIFTPNGDANNDRFPIENIDLYDNHTVSIYNINDELIFESNDYGSSLDELFPVEPQNDNGVVGVPDGTYKYKIVVENEEIFKKSGFFCLFTNNPPLEQQNFAECNPLAPGEFDQILTGL